MKKFKNTYRKKAFTLAEVLIVLGIIGVIAAITIPALIANNQDRAAIVSMKKSASVLSSAFKLAQFNEDKIENWYTGSNDSEAALKVIEIMKKYLNTTQTCSDSDSSCFPTIGTVNIGLTSSISINSSNIARFSLADGSSIALKPTLSGNEIYEFLVYIDINGFKQPNRYGWDIFQFVLYTETKALSKNVKPLILIPYGATSNNGALSSTCDRNTTSSNANEIGSYCSAWAYFIGNRDYLRCDNLNWQTKLSCD